MDKVKEVLIELIGSEVNIRWTQAEVDRLDQAAHQLNQMLIEARIDELEYIDERGGITSRLKALKADKDNHADQ